MSQDLADLLSDVKVFVDDCCDIGPEYEVLVAALFARWQLWCAQRGIRHSWGDKQFSAKVVSVVPTIRRGRPRETPTRKTKLLGIRLASSLNKKSGEIERLSGMWEDDRCGTHGPATIWFTGKKTCSQCERDHLYHTYHLFHLF
jgi:hypothetical protein